MLIQYVWKLFNHFDPIGLLRIVKFYKFWRRKMCNIWIFLWVRIKYTNFTPTKIWCVFSIVPHGETTTLRLFKWIKKQCLFRIAQESCIICTLRFVQSYKNSMNHLTLHNRASVFLEYHLRIQRIQIYKRYPQYFLLSCTNCGAHLSGPFDVFNYFVGQGTCPAHRMK
jgi:hypothetical protein